MAAASPSLTDLLAYLYTCTASCRWQTRLVLISTAAASPPKCTSNRRCANEQGCLPRHPSAASGDVSRQGSIFELDIATQDVMGLTAFLTDQSTRVNTMSEHFLFTAQLAHTILSNTNWWHTNTCLLSLCVSRYVS